MCVCLNVYEFACVCVCVCLSDRSLLSAASAYHARIHSEARKNKSCLQNALFAACMHQVSCCGRHPGDMHSFIPRRSTPPVLTATA